jgi:hypothetical protein
LYACSCFTSFFSKKLNQKNFSFPKGFSAELAEELKKKNLSCELVGTVSYDEGAVAKIIEIKQNGICSERYYIDVIRGYLCPYAWAVNETTGFSTEISAQKYFREKQTSLYYPQIYKVQQKMSIGEHTEEYQLLPETLRFNQSISDREFAIDIPEDAYVHDWSPLKPFSEEELKKINSGIPITRESILYRAIEKGTISFVKGAFEIDKLKWLKRDKLSAEETPETGRVISYRRMILIFVGTIFILFALYRMSRWDNVEK